jgi:pantetheine-phosphate adenylyltransferase
LTKAFCPGSFDPVTNGHLDVVERAARIFDEVVVGILHNPRKAPLFSLQERMEMLQETVAHLPNVRVVAADGLLVEVARESGAHVIVKGLRAIQDFEYEFQMGMVNKRLAPDIETMFLMSSDRYSYLSSSIVRELASYGASLDGLVPPGVERRLREKYAKQ